MLHIVGIGDIIYSDKKSDSIVTHSLGSCVGVTAYDKRKKIGGMIHIALPRTLNSNKNYKNGYFAEIGLPLFIETMLLEYRSLKTDLEFKIYGGANSIKGNDVFNIGNKNIIYVKNFLDNYRLEYKMVATGGYQSRTIELNIESGEVKLSELPIII